MNEIESQRAAIVAHGREAIAEIQAEAEAAVAHAVAVVEMATGVRLAAGPPSVMDATREQLADADVRAQHAVAAMDIVLRRWSWGDAQALGQLMPELPPDVREKVVDHLVRAGLS